MPERMKEWFRHNDLRFFYLPFRVRGFSAIYYDPDDGPLNYKKKNYIFSTIYDDQNDEKFSHE